MPRRALNFAGAGLGLGLCALALALPVRLAALDFVSAQGAAFSAGGRPLALRGMRAKDADDALRLLQAAPAAGVNLILIDVDSLPASATPGVPSEAGWRRLDQVLATAARTGVYVLPGLVSFAPGGSAARFSALLGGSGPGLYLDAGQARVWWLYLVRMAASRRNSVSGLDYRDDPALFGWSLGTGLADQEDPQGMRARDWVLRGAQALKGLDPRHLVGLDYGLPVVPAAGKAAALDFLVLPAEAADEASSELARPLLLDDGPGDLSFLPAPKPLLLGRALVGLTGAHEAEVAVRSSEPALIQVDYGDAGWLDSNASAAPGTLARIKLRGLKSGAGYTLRLRARTADGREAASPLLTLAVPDEPRLPPKPAPYSGAIIQAHDGRFWDGGAPFRYVGANNYDLRYESDPEALAQVLDTARDMGLRVLRCQANGELFAPRAPDLFQPLRWMVAGSPTGWQEDSWASYDRLMAEAAKRGLRVILYFTDNWEYFGGMKTWARWRGHDDKNAFYTDPQVQADFKGLIRRWVTRVNTVTGVRYADDPALFSWELANEPRDEDDPSSKAVAAWADGMAGYVKTLDPKHMVSVGLEGFHAVGGTHYSGADFVQVQSSPHLDFATFHFYPVNDSRRYSLRACKRALRDYVALGHDVLHKPVVMEEFGIGKQYDGDLNRFEWVQTLAKTFMQAGGDGENYWMLVADSYQGGDGNEYQPRDVDYCDLFSGLASDVNSGVRP